MQSRRPLRRVSPFPHLGTVSALTISQQLVSRYCGDALSTRPKHLKVPVQRLRSLTRYWPRSYGLTEMRLGKAFNMRMIIRREEKMATEPASAFNKMAKATSNRANPLKLSESCQPQG